MPLDTRPAGKGGPARVAGVAAAVALLAVTGCSADSTPAEPAAPPSPSLSPSLPPRTKQLSLRGADPCRLLTPEQLDQLKENGTPRPIAPEDQRDGPTCAFDVDAAPPTYTYYLETITNADLTDWVTGQHRKTSMIVQPVAVPGFPALVRYAPDEGGVLDCETLVGVAAGETLRAQVAPDDRSLGGQQQLCDMSTNLAKLALQTLGATP